MKKIIKYTAAFLLVMTSAFAGKAVNTSGASGIALQGYDPVAFFTVGKPTHGDPSIQVKHGGAIYLFASEASQAQFQQDPEKYVPQFGGYCAYGISVNALFPIDINTAQVVDGKLYVNLNPAILSAFNKDFAGNVMKAHSNWPELVGEKVNSGNCSDCRTGSNKDIRGR